MPRRALVNTKRNVLMPPGYPIILLKYGRRIGKMVYCSLYQSSSSLSISAPFAVVFMHSFHVWSSNLYILFSLVAVVIVSMLLNLLTHQKTRTKRKHAVCSLQNCLQCLIYQPYVVHLLNNLKVFEDF